MRRAFSVFSLFVFGLVIFNLAALAGSPAWAERTPAPAGARVYIISPADGATVTNPVTVLFGLDGMGVAPAGVDTPATGHHHLLIDVGLPQGDDLNYSVPADENHLHFGGGQTQTTLELAPGPHTLQLLLGDENHVPHDPPVASDKITIMVTE